MSSALLDERLPPLNSKPPPLVSNSSTAEALQNNHVLYTIFSQLLDEPDALALLSECGRVCKAWRKAAIEDPRLWRSLTAWKSLPVPQISQPLDTGELAPVSAARDGEDSDSEGGWAPPPVSQDDAYATKVNSAVLRRLVTRSDGQLRRLDASPLGLAFRDIIRALDGQVADGQLESLCVDGVEIQADLSSLRAFKKSLSSLLVDCCMRGAKRCIPPGTDVNEELMRLAMGDPENGTPPDERFAAYLDDPPPADMGVAINLYLTRTHAKLASFLRKP